MADTIREYLVSLGFTVNEAQLHNFRDVLSGTARSTANLGAEVVGAGLAIAEMVEQVARHFENLYYMSQRTGSTVASLDAVGFAARQVGLSADQSRGAVEAFAHSLRVNPGMGGLFQSLTGQRLGADNEANVRTLVKRLSRMPDFVALQFASQFGIPEEVFLHYKNNMAELERAEKEHRVRMREAGLDADVEARKFTEFTRVLNTMQDSFSILGTRIAHDWREPVQGMVADIGYLVDSFNKADTASEGILGKVSSLIAAFGGVSVILALLGRLFGFKGGTHAANIIAGGGVTGLGLAVVSFLMGNDKESINMRTGLRSMLGMEDPHEPLPWQPGGAWQTGPSGAASTPLTRMGHRPWGQPEDSTLYRSPVGSTSRIWGDEEGVRAGLYDPLPGNVRGRRGGKGAEISVAVTQNNNITGVRDAEGVKDAMTDARRRLADAMRTAIGQQVQ